VVNENWWLAASALPAASVTPVRTVTVYWVEAASAADGVIVAAWLAAS
jgi:hypothetical protein